MKAAVSESFFCYVEVYIFIKHQSSTRPIKASSSTFQLGIIRHLHGKAFVMVIYSKSSHANNVDEELTKLSSCFLNNFYILARCLQSCVLHAGPKAPPTQYNIGRPNKFATHLHTHCDTRNTCFADKRDLRQLYEPACWKTHCATDSIEFYQSMHMCDLMMGTCMRTWSCDSMLLFKNA